MDFFGNVRKPLHRFLNMELVYFLPVIKEVEKASYCPVRKIGLVHVWRCCEFIWLLFGTSRA